MLSADLAAKQILPELSIGSLFCQCDENEELVKIAQESLLEKRKKKEKTEVAQQDQEKILTIIKSFIRKIENMPPSQNKHKKNNLTNILTEYSLCLKEKYYHKA